MDLFSIPELLSSLAMLMSAAGALYAWLTARSKANTEAIEKIDETLAGHDRRLAAVESEFKHLPAKEDVHNLQLTISELKGTVGRLDEQVAGATRTMRRVEDFLMNSGARGKA